MERTKISDRLSPKEIKEKLMNLFNKSNKKHLLITGSKGIGKSTLLRELLEDSHNYGGVVADYVVSEGSLPKLILRDILDENICGLVGIKPGLRMEPILGGFENTGVSILRRYRNSHKELIVIDEIGFLELEAEKYIEEIFLCIKEKKLIAILRKQDNPLIDRIKEIENAFIVDLDQFMYEK